MKKLFLFLVLGLFLVSFVSASIYYEEENKTYIIDTWIPNWLGGDGESTVTLIDNTDQCLIDCSFTIEGYNEQPVNLIDDFYLLDRNGNDASKNLRSISFKLGTYQEVEKINYSSPIYSNEETCTIIEQNNTNQSYQSCHYDIIGYDTYLVNELVWQEYDGQDVDGYWQLKADAKKNPVSMDWVIKFRGKDLTNWAWWDTNWLYKREISNLTGNISALITIPYSENMNSNFSDLRFIDNTETIELNYTIENKSDGNWAFVRVNNLGQNSIYMYYGNAAASDNSNASDVYFNPVSVYYLDSNANDFVGSNDGTVNGATLTTGYINGSYSFDGVSDYINFGEIPVTTAISVSVWAYFSDNLGNPIISKRTNGNNWQISSTNGNYNAYFLVWTSGGSGTANTGTGDIIQNTWHNIVGTYDGSNVRIYLDGVLKDTQPLTGTIMNNSNIIKFGTDSPGGSNYYNGKIDELYVYNKNLTQDQITKLYTQTAPNFIEGSETNQAGLTISGVIPSNNTYSINSYNQFNLSVNIINNETEYLENITFNIYYQNGTKIYNSTNSYGDITTITESFNYTFDDGFYLWNFDVCSTISCLSIVNRTIGIDTVNPTIEIFSPNETLNYTYNGYILQLNFTATDTNLDTCLVQYNNTNTTYNCQSGVLNSTYFNYEKDMDNITIYINDTFGRTVNDIISWSYKIFENNRTLNSSTYQTAYETYTINLENPTSITNIKFTINGVEYSPTESGKDYTYSLDAPTNVIQNNSVAWKFTDTDGSFYSNYSYQNVTEINFYKCNATLTDDFLNITFKDEENFSIISESIPLSTFTYYLGTGTSNKTYQYINSSEVPSIEFCSTTTNRTLYVYPYMQYKKGTTYPQRIWQPSVRSYNSTVTNQSLYSLISTSGIYTTFQVINTADQVISGVDVTATREISGESVDVGIGTTASSGTVTFWLNPDFVHDYVFSKTGLDTVTTSFAPTQTAYTITMGGTLSTANSSMRGIDYDILPTDLFLENDTNYTFGFTLTSSYWDVSEYGFNLRLANGTIITGDSTSVEGTALTKLYNVNNQTLIYLDAYWVINDEYTNITRVWAIQNTEYTGYGIKTFFEDLNFYLDSGLFGIDNFGRYLIAFIIIFISVGIMGYKFGISSPLGLISLLFGIVLFFDSVVGLLPAIRGVEHLPTFIAGLILILAILNEVKNR